MSQPEETTPYRSLYQSLDKIRQDLIHAESAWSAELESIPLENRASATNLIHYLALRNHDLRAVQTELGCLGLSSLGRLEAHVMASIESVMSVLARLLKNEEPSITCPPKERFWEGDLALIRNTDLLFGPANSDRVVRIMVTLPSDAAEDYALVRNLMESGMDLARINSAHDVPEKWGKMVKHCRRAEKELNRSCKILFDLCGPKLRTGAIAPSLAVYKIRPEKDSRGVVLQPAQVWIGHTLPPSGKRIPVVSIPVDEAFINKLLPEDRLRFKDLPGRMREFRVVGTSTGGVWAEIDRTAYLEAGVEFSVVRDNQLLTLSQQILSLPEQESAIWLSIGDSLKLTAGEENGHPTQYHSDGSVLKIASIPCTLPSVFKEVEVGDPILFNDGKFSGTIREVQADHLMIHIENTPPGGARLRSDKGINLPHSELSLPSLSDQDVENLDFAVEKVDMVGLSFVRTAEDVTGLHHELKSRNRPDMALILKIENRKAFENLNELLMTGLQGPSFGVMVARGDLGVEVGFDMLAEAQEQILWLCEAAHIPVIWATQVLETLTKKGTPTRAEISDASMSGRAECVMLNKGAFVLNSVKFLDRIIIRMRDHHHKKTPMLRKLKISEGRFRTRYFLGEKEI